MNRHAPGTTIHAVVVVEGTTKKKKKKWRVPVFTVLLFLWVCGSTIYFSSSGDSNDGSNHAREPPATGTTPDYCERFDGVLWISQGDRNGAAGTIFFLFVLNQLLYAERYNLQPWIHLNSVSKRVWDDQIHNHNTTTTTTFELGPELPVSWDVFQDPLVPSRTFLYPGKPAFLMDMDMDMAKISTATTTTTSAATAVQVEGTGVWNSYFQSIITIPLKNKMGEKKVDNHSHNQQYYSYYNVDITRPCPHKPFAHLQSDDQLVKGLHLNCPYCVRSWKYGGLPPSLKQTQPQSDESFSSSSYHDWWKPMRRTGHRIVTRYFQPQPYLWQLVQQANPIKLKSTSGKQQQQPKQQQRCLAMHIRHSDKANKRNKIPVAAFLPYCQTYLQVCNTTTTTATTADSDSDNAPPPPFIYLATDSSRVLDKIQAEWPPEVVTALRWQSNVIRSHNSTAVFDAVLSSTATTTSIFQQHQQQQVQTPTIPGRHHRTNTEVLVDILAMAQCDWFVHGLSAVSEATFYYNPQLHDRSVNLEFYRYYKRRQQSQSQQNYASGGDAPMPVQVFRNMLLLEQ